MLKRKMYPMRAQPHPCPRQVRYSLWGKGFEVDFDMLKRTRMKPATILVTATFCPAITN